MFQRNMIAVVAVLVFMITGTEAQCSERTNIYVPIDNDCAGFYYCNAAGQVSAIPEPCDMDAGYMWSQKHQVCDHSDQVDCSQNGNYWIRSDALAGRSEALCYDHGSEKLEDSTSCKKYFQCHSDMGRIDDCPPDHYFRKLSGECVQFQFLEPQRQEYCALIHNLVTEVSADCPQHETSRITYPSDCSRYYYCNLGNRCVIYCPTGKYFDFISTSCVSHDVLTGAQQAYCTDMGIVIEDEGAQQHAPYNGRCSKGFTGSIQDPYSCMKYERCIDGYSTMVYCDDGLYYNPNIGICTRANTLDEHVRAQCGLPMEQCYTDSVSVMFDQHDCGRVIVCVHRHATIYQCPHMEIFSRDMLKCVPATPANSAHCATYQECTDAMYSILSTDDGCSRAEVCYFGNRYVLQCTICGQVVSSSVLACRDPTDHDIYRCSLNMPHGPTAVSSCSGSSQGYYAADSADATGKHYYKCNGGNAEMRFKCPGNLHYSDGLESSGGGYNTPTPSCKV